MARPTKESKELAELRAAIADRNQRLNALNQEHGRLVRKLLIANATLSQLRALVRALDAAQNQVSLEEPF